jgi:hypothetical protein
MTGTQNLFIQENINSHCISKSLLDFMYDNRVISIYTTIIMAEEFEENRWLKQTATTTFLSTDYGITYMQNKLRQIEEGSVGKRQSLCTLESRLH